MNEQQALQYLATIALVTLGPWVLAGAVWIYLQFSD